MMIWSDFEFVIHLACIIKTRILDIIWPCLLIIMIMTWLFSGILFICALEVSFAARARSVRAANDTTRAQINDILEKSHVISLLCMDKKHWAVSVFWKLFVRKWGGYLTFTALRIQILPFLHLSDYKCICIKIWTRFAKLRLHIVKM